MRAHMKKLEDESIAAMKNSMLSEGSGLCIEMLSGMESGKSDLDRLLRQ